MLLLLLCSTIAVHSPAQVHRQKSETFDENNLAILFNVLDYDGGHQTDGDTASDGELTNDEIQVSSQ